MDAAVLVDVVLHLVEQHPDQFASFDDEFPGRVIDDDLDILLLGVLLVSVLVLAILSLMLLTFLGLTLATTTSTANNVTA